jgi:hypothetical protein
MAGKIERAYRVRCPVCLEDEFSILDLKKYAEREFRGKGWVTRRGLWCHGECAPYLVERRKAGRG